VRFVTCDGVRWIREGDRVLVLLEEEGVSVWLEGLDAAIWGMLCRGASARSVVETAAALEGGDEHASRERLRGLLDDLKRLNLVRVVAGDLP
jgi:hypothetical protein